MGAISSLYAIADAKIQLNDKEEYGFGQYLQLLTNKPGLSNVSGFVYDATHCTLMTATKGSVVKIATMKWTDEGSLNYIQRYLRHPGDFWHHAVITAASVLNTDISLFSTKTPGCCILGCGAVGRVFRVRREDGKECALKVVLGPDNAERLNGEFETILNLQNEGTTCIVGVHSDSFIRQNLDQSCFAAYLMPEVGKSWTSRDKVEERDVRGMLSALSDLHTFGKVCHGDARYRNVVRTATVFKWIDLRGLKMNSYYVFADFKLLLQSLELPVNEEAIKEFAKVTSWDSDEARRTAAENLLN
jgi:hypothetical protein